MGSDNTNGQAIINCPISGTKGKLVKTDTLRSLTNEEERQDANSR